MHRLADRSAIAPAFIGNPFKGIFDADLARLPAGFEKARALMAERFPHARVVIATITSMEENEMRLSLTSIIAVCAVAGFTAPALADCQQELAELRTQGDSEAGGGIAKDGSLAPLESAGEGNSADASESSSDVASQAGQSVTDDGTNEIAKDGSQAPLDTDTSSIATSGQDAAAQQDGTSSTQDTAADDMSPEMHDALERAEAALADGDEAGCMAAVEEARTL